jgi:hypothetical protein
LARLEAEAMADDSASHIRRQRRFARVRDEQWLIPRPGSRPIGPLPQQHWQETRALRALTGPVRRRYLADCGSARRRALSNALVRVLRQTLPVPEPEPRTRLVYRIQVLPIRGKADEKEDVEAPVEADGRTRAVLLRARVVPSSPSQRFSCLASTPRISLVMPYLAAADREAIAAAVLGPIRHREKCLLMSSSSTLVAAVPSTELAGVERVLAALGSGDVEKLQALLAAAEKGTEAFCSPAAPLQGDDIHVAEPEATKPSALVPSHALEVIMELRGVAPPKDQWWALQGRLMVATRLRKLKAMAAAAAAPTPPTTKEEEEVLPAAEKRPPPVFVPCSPSPPTPPPTPTTPKQEEAIPTPSSSSSGEQLPSPPVRPASPRSHRHVTWVEPVVELEVGPEGGSSSSTTTTTTSGGGRAIGKSIIATARRNHSSRRVRAAGLLVLGVVAAIVLLVTSLWKERSLSPSVRGPGLEPSDERQLTPLPPTPEHESEPESEAEAVVGEGANGLLLLQRREPLTYADWQRAARAK